MNKLRLIVFGMLAFMVTLIGGVAFYWHFYYYSPFLVTTSPDQKYTVELTGDKGRGGFLIYAVVKYNLLASGKMLTKGRELHYGDFMDISFELAYPEHQWIDERTLRLWSNVHRTEGNLDTLLITNNTDKVVRFLRIKSEEVFFVFDVQPQSQVRLQLTHRSESIHIHVEGKFQDGAQIDYGVGFPRMDKTPTGFCLDLEYDRVTINSPDKKGYDEGGNWDNLNIDSSPNCVPDQLRTTGANKNF